jgi:hypothetical protein
LGEWFGGWVLETNFNSYGFSWSESRAAERDIVFRGTGDADSLWNVAVTPPKASGVVFKGNEASPVSLTQQFPVCRFGRAGRRASVREPDVAGAAALYNASPYGEWTIELAPLAENGTKRKSVDDVYIDLFVAFLDD